MAKASHGQTLVKYDFHGSGSKIALSIIPTGYKGVPTP